MAKKIIVILLVICCMTITINAEILTSTYSPPNYFVGYYDYSTGSDDPDGYTVEYNLNAYYSDNTNKVSSPIPIGYDYCPLVGTWTSYIEYDTIYKFSMYLDFDGLSEELKTGMLDEARLAIMPSTYFADVDSANVGNQQVVAAPEYSQYDIYTTEKQYHIFYDAKRKQLSAIFTVPSTWAQERDVTNFNNFLIVELGYNYGTVTTSTVELVSYTGLTVKDNYTDILEEIRDKLETMAGGGGLTEEQVNQAVQDALEAHDAQLEHEVGGKLDQILEQINGIVSPYSEAADQINTAFDGLSDVFSSTSTASVFKFPAGRMPNGVLLWQEHSIDIGAAWLKIPAKFRSVVQIVCTFTILYAVIQEAIFVIRFIILGRKGAQDD